MSSEGDPSEHVAEPILDGEMLSVTDSETEREKENYILQSFCNSKMLFLRCSACWDLSLSLTLFEFFIETR